MKLEWDRLEKLRAPASLSIALQHLGIYRIYVIRKELRGDEQSDWVEVPMWLKDTRPFMERVASNEVGREILKKLRDQVREESLYLKETVFKTNGVGLTEIIVPLVVRGDRIGFIRTGGIVLEDAVVGDVALEEQFKILMFSQDDLKEAKEEWRRLPHFGADKRVIVIQMLELLAQEIVQFFDESLTAQEREEAVHKHTFSQMVTANLALRGTLKRLNQLAGGDSSVLITGEPGTGRELLANMIHERSDRSEKPFRTFHCSSVAENLMEAELLGYEKGAFPGAYTEKKGLLEICNGGTLLLKEISDLSLSMQLKILRILQEKSFTPLGSDKPVRVDVRIIASTQRNLRKLIQMGAFREDLYFQLNGIELELPPLRQRKEDIRLLGEHFLQNFTKKMGKEGIQWKDGALEKLTSHSFPGNVRELRNEVERLVAMKDSHSFIEVADLNKKIAENRTPVDEMEKGRTLKEIVDDFEKDIISEAMLKYNWNKSKVAALFQITRQGLLKKITKYRLDKRRRA